MRGEAWSKSEQLQLESMAAEGLSAAQAGPLLGKTRNAILGRAFRTGVQFHGERLAPAKTERAPRPASGRRGGRAKGQYIKPRALILQCLALHLAGTPQVRAAKVFGVSKHSVSKVWMKDPALVAEARSIADRALAEARAIAAERGRKLNEARAIAHAQLTRCNEAVFQTLRPRHVEMLRAYIRLGSLALAGAEIGVTRERIRQVVEKAKTKGFQNPFARDGMRPLAKYRRAA